MTSHATQRDLHLREALQYMKEHPDAKISRVAREFNINRNTLKARFNGGTSRAGFPAQNTLLSRPEKALCRYIERLEQTALSCMRSHCGSVVPVILKRAVFHFSGCESCGLHG